MAGAKAIYSKENAEPNVSVAAGAGFDLLHEETEPTGS